MDLRSQIMADVKTAMKEKQQTKLSTLRFLQSAIKNREIELRPQEITDDEVQGVIKRLVKQRKESIEQYKAGGRTDLAEQEAAELSVLETYLPAQMGKDQLESLVSEVIQSLGASSVKDMGSVMKEVIARAQGAADNKMVSEIVKSRLQ